MPYSVLRHMAQSILLSEYRNNLPVAMFTAFFDASGTKRKSILTVAGFVSRIEKWTRFDQEWKEILDAHGVSQFHMTDFASSKGEFDSWRGKTAQRRELIERLAGCIKRNINKGFGASLVIDDFNKVNKDYPLAEFGGSPFALCARTCTGGLKNWAMKKGLDIGKVLVFFEDGDENRGDFLDRARADGIRITLLAKDESRAFQAADLAAWKVRTALHGILEADSREEAEQMFRSLEPIEGLLVKNGVFDEKALRALCVKGGAPKRDTITL